ncbi:MAG: hypothetical protein AAF702_32990 [Chloroflexota bacterium]
MLTPKGIKYISNARDVNFPKNAGNDGLAMVYDHATGKFIPGSSGGGGGGSGDVSGPSSSADNAIVRFDGVTGKVVQGYTSNAPTIADDGELILASGSIRPLVDGLNSLKVQNASGSSNVLTIDTTNKRVGINTDPGDFALNVVGSTFDIVRFRRSNSNNAAIRFENGAGEFYFGVTKTDADFAVSTSTSLHSGSLLKVTRAGQVGINEQSPTALLHLGIGSVARAQLRFDVSSNPTSGNDGDVWYSSASSRLTFKRGSTDELFATGVQQTGGAATAAASYTSNEQTMLQAVYDAAREFGLLD